jgi:hypothetical protein
MTVPQRYVLDLVHFDQPFGVGEPDKCGVVRVTDPFVDRSVTDEDPHGTAGMKLAGGSGNKIFERALRPPRGTDYLGVTPSYLDGLAFPDYHDVLRALRDESW